MSSAPAPAPNTGLTRWTVLVGAIVVQLILGTVYGYSIFWQPLQAEIFPSVITPERADELARTGADLDRYVIAENYEEKERLQDQQKGYLKYAFSICILSFAVTMVIAGRVQDVRGPRFTAIIGAVLMSLGFILAGLMGSSIVYYIAHAAFAGAVALVLMALFDTLLQSVASDNTAFSRHAPLAIVCAVAVAAVMIGVEFVGKSGEFDRLLLLWGTIGFLAGAGIGFAYVCPIAALIKWFPQHKGLVSGLAVAGFGFGAYLFKGEGMFGAFGYIREHGIISFFVVHGIVCFIAVTLGALMLQNPPGTSAKSPATAGDTSWQETLRRPAFYIIWLMFFSGAMAGLMVIGIVKGFAGEQLVSAAEAADGVLTAATRDELLAKGAAAVGWLAIFNAVGRVVWGLISDRVGRTGALVAMFLFQAIMMFVLTAMKTELSLAVGASIVGFNFGGNFALFPSLTADLFGAKNLGANYGWVFTSYGIAGVVGIAAGNAAKTMTGEYSQAFIAAGCLCILSAVLAIGLQIARNRAAKPATG